jgi:hypothetical protein
MTQQIIASLEASNGINKYSYISADNHKQRRSDSTSGYNYA